MYPWKTVINLNRESNTPLFLQISNALIREISYGRIKAGQALPGSRVLSEMILVNRKTTVIAYDELMSQGWIEIVPSKGAFVTKDLPLVKYRRIPQYKEVNYYPEKTCFQLARPERASYSNPKPSTALVIDDGSPDIRLAPLDTIWRHCRSFTRGALKNRLLAYGDLQGDPKLREVLSDYLRNTRGLACTKEHIIITRGSIMALNLVIQEILSPGDVVVVGAPNYPAANNIITDAGGTLITIPVDDFGINTFAIEELCSKQEVKAVYITPHHHFPTTVTLSAERRLHLLELSHKYRFAIIEDDYDYDFHYNSGPILPLASFDQHGSVVYMGSFSKLLAPGIRVGYLVAPRNLVSALCHARRYIDRQGDFVMERALAQLIVEGDLQRHLKKSLKAYRIRRDLFCKELTKYCEAYISFQIPEGGMVVWSKFHSRINLTKLKQYLTSKQVVLDVDREILKNYHATRLGFASLNEQEIMKATTILGAGLSQSLD